MVYTDGIHLVADELDELHRFARNITLSKCWFHNPRGKNHPHYDIICAHKLQRAYDYGAKPVTKKELLRIIQKNLVV